MAPTNAAPSYSITAALAQLPSQQALIAQSRLHALNQQLQQVSPFSLRDDSRLAMMAACGQLPPFWNDDVVTNEMCVVQWICETTPYVRLSQPVMRLLADHIKTAYRIKNWSTVWRIVTKYAPDLIRHDCVANHASGYGFIPDFCPILAATLPPPPPSPQPQSPPTIAWADNVVDVGPEEEILPNDDVPPATGTS
jgi:hypothetical protein